MSSLRKTALVGGILYLVTFLGSIPAAVLVGPALDASYIAGPGADQQVRFALVLELVNVFGCIACGVAFFSVVRRVHEGLAIGYVTTRLFEAVTITVGVISLLTLVSLRQGPAAGDSAAFGPVAEALVEVRRWAMVLGPNMAGFNALMLGTALYKGRLVPRALPALGLVGAPLLISYVIATVLGFNPGTIWMVVAVMPFFVWELVLGLWLTFKGFNESSPLAIAERERIAPAAALAKAGAA